MHSPSAGQLHVPGLMQIMSIKKKNKKEAKKMSEEITLGEFYNTAGKTFELSDIESEENFPLYVSPYLGDNKQIHVNNSQSIRVFSEDGKQDEAYADDSAVKAVLEGVIFSYSDEPDSEDTTILYDIGSVGDEGLHDIGFEDRLEILHKLSDETPMFNDAMIVDWEKVNNFTELTDYIHSLSDDNAEAPEGIRVKKPDSAFGEEVIIPLGEEKEGEVALEEGDAPPEEIEEPFTPAQDEAEQLKLV